MSDPMRKRMDNFKRSAEILRKSSDRLKQPRQPTLTLTSSRLQILKTTLDNMERQLEILMLSDRSFTDSNRRRRGSASGRGSLCHTIGNIKLRIREEEKKQQDLTD